MVRRVVLVQMYDFARCGKAISRDEFRIYDLQIMRIGNIDMMRNSTPASYFTCWL